MVSNICMIPEVEIERLSSSQPVGGKRNAHYPINSTEEKREDN